MHLTNINNIQLLFFGADPMSFKQIFSGLQVRGTQQIQQQLSEVSARSFASHVTSLCQTAGVSITLFDKIKTKIKQTDV